MVVICPGGLADAVSLGQALAFVGLNGCPFLNWTMVQGLLLLNKDLDVYNTLGKETAGKTSDD